MRRHAMVITMFALSLLWLPDERGMPLSDTAFVRDLGLSDLVHLHGDRAVGEVELDLASFFTANPATMRLRTEMFLELLETPGLFDALKDSFGRLSDIYALQNVREGSLSEEQLLYSIRELEAYLDYLSAIKAIFESYSIRSELLRGLWQAIEPLASGEDYDRLRAAVERQNHAVKNIRSITVGVNLDPTLRAVEAGVVSVNEESYVSGETISHLLRLNFKKDAYTCMTPLYPTTRRLTPQEQAAMGDTVHIALRKIFGDSLKSWAAVIKNHVLGNLHMLAAVAEEWRFVAAAVDTLQKLRRRGMPLCRPTITAEGNERIDGLYHPALALRAERPSAMVRNTLTFDENGRLYILTGPNSGGKSVYLQSVGLAYAMLHLGLPLAAEQATMVPVDGILTHFADIRDGSFRHGRLGAECERIQVVNHAARARSLILFDEALSGTNATEAVAISTEILAAYAEIGVRGLWVTHFHDLCRLPDTLGEGVSARLANLSARLDPTSHERLFIIEPGDGEARSYALDIAERFHLTRQEILSAAGEGKG